MIFPSQGESFLTRHGPGRGIFPGGQLVKHRDKHISATDHGTPPVKSWAGRIPSWLSHDQGWAYWLKTTVLILVLLAVIYPGAVFRGEVFQSGDADNSLMFSKVGDQALAQGEYPLWNPYLFAGMPSFGSLAYVRYLYPPSVVFNFLQSTLAFPPLTWMLGHLLFGGLGMVWLLRRWSLNQAEVLLGVVIWLLFPKVVAWGVHGHGSKLGAAMYLPWIVGWALKVLDGRSWRALAMTGLLLGFQLLRGHIQIVYYTLGLVAWFAVWSVLWPMEPSWRNVAARLRLFRVGQLILGLGLGFLIAGILLIPVHDYARISIRGQDASGGGGVGLDYATGWSLAPREMTTFVLPSAVGFGQATYLGRMPFNDYPNYFGFLSLMLAGVAWGLGRRRWFVVLGLLTVLVVMVSWGNFGFGLYELLYRWLPFFNKFRVPSMILILAAFVLAITAPRGVRALREAKVGGPGWLPVAFCGGLGLVLLLAGGLQLAQNGYFAQLQKLAAMDQKPAPRVLLDAAWNLQKGDLISIGLLLLVSAAALQLARVRVGFRQAGLPWVLVLLVVVDLGRVDGRITRPQNDLLRVGRSNSGQTVLLPALSLGHKLAKIDAQPAPNAELLKAETGHDRVFPLGNEGGRNTWMAAGIRSLGGYHPAKLAAFETIRKRLYGQMPAGRVANWLSARVVSFERAFTPEELTLLRSLGLDLEAQPLTGSAPFLYRNSSYLPRARLVGRWVSTSGGEGGLTLETFLDGVGDGTIDPAAVVHVAGLKAEESSPGAVAPVVALPAPTFVTDGLNEVVLHANAPSAAMLVLADMNAPGWQVFVDDEPQHLLTADFVLRAVLLQKGDHVVRFEYHDPGVRRGLIMTGTGLILTLGLILLTMRRPRMIKDLDGRLET